MPTGMAKIVPDNLFAFPPSMVVIGKEREHMYRRYGSRAMHGAEKRCAEERKLYEKTFSPQMKANF